MDIYTASSSDYPEIVVVWEASVRATHHFVTEEDLQFFKSMVVRYLEAVELFCTRDAGAITGFLGVSEGEIQMLFLHPDFRGQGIGRRLMEFAITEKHATKVEVNEQNPQAVGFYEHMGFRTTARSETDGLGKPYPILSMELL